MWLPNALLFLSAGLAAADYAWQPGKRYTYKIEARTAAGLHQVADQYSGTHVQGQLNVIVDSENQLTLQVQEPRFADFNQHLHEGWETHISEGVNYKTFPTENRPFQIHLKNGVIEKLIVDKGITKWELNFIKAIASQFQVDIQAHNIKTSKHNNVPEGDQDTGVYKTMEESINGKYETLYEVSGLPEYFLQIRQELAPLQLLRGDGKHYRIVKTRNFSNSDRHVVYRYGFHGHEGWNAGTNTMGNFLARSSVSTIVCSGRPNRYTIQSTETTEKVLVAPFLYNFQKGIVASRFNLTLEEINEYQGSSLSIDNPQAVESLIYEYEYEKENSDSLSSLSTNEEGNQPQAEQWRTKEINNHSSASSSSSSSEEQDIGLSLGWKSMMRNYSSSSSSSSEHKYSALRHRLQNQYKSSSSSSSFSSEDSSIKSNEEYLPPQPKLNGVPYIEFLPDSVVNQHNKEQTVQSLVWVARQIGQSLNNPNDILNDNVLTLYAILTRLAGSASSQQLEEATKKIYCPAEKVEKSENQEVRDNYRSWQAYRDAVAHAGSGPALVTISSWIKSGFVKGNEAAQLVAVLPKTTRYPTTEYMNFFFDLVKSKEVQSQKYLNDSGILSFTELVRRSQVDRKTSRHRYPIHLAGAESRNHRALVAQRYIPYLQRRLENAIAEGDSVKTQVYIRALSNTAHPNILEILEPYLEGKRYISQFQRLLMVTYLDDFINLHPKTAQSILYNIYQRVGEAPEIRVAAVMQLMKTDPSPQMLQRMAEQTNKEFSHHVRAAVKSAIESLANNEFHTNPQLPKNAGYASGLLTPEHYGFEHSQIFIKSYIDKVYRSLQDQHYLTYIKGLDGLYPSSVIYNLRRRIGGYQFEHHTDSFMSSSSEELLRLLSKRLGERDHHEKERSEKIKRSGSEYTYDKINDLLGGKFDTPLQVEGNIFFKILGGPRYFSFDKYTIDRIPDAIKEINEKLNDGINIDECKFYNLHSIEIGFPLVTGVRFTYSYNEPSLAYLAFQGNGYLQQHKIERNQQYRLPLSGSVDGQYQLVWSQQKRGKLGFVAPYSEQRHIAAIEKNAQLYIPLQGKFEFNGNSNLFKAKIQPYTDKSKQPKLFQLSTNLYTTYHNVYDVKPYLRGKNAQLIHISQSKSYQQSFGQDHSGYDFQIEAQSENDFTDIVRITNAIRNLEYDYIVSTIHHGIMHTLANNYYALSYNPRNSSTHLSEISFYLNSKQVADQEPRSAPEKSHPKIKLFENPAIPSSEDNRIDELEANAQSGIQDAYTYTMDAFISFGDSPKNGRYAFTAVHAMSPVSEKARSLFYISGIPYHESHDAKRFQTAFQVNYKYPQIPLFNYRQAYEVDPTSYVQGHMNFDHNEHSRIAFEGIMQQTEERKNYVKANPYSYVCENQEQQGNHILPACRNASVHANLLNKYDFTFKYQHVPQTFQKAAYTIYKIARHLGYQYNYENFVGVKNSEGRLKFNAEFSGNLKSLNFSLEGPSFTSHFENIEINRLVKPFLIKYPGYNQLHHFSPSYFYTRPFATCAIDGNEASTFNNKSYSINLGNCYHVLVISNPREYDKYNQESSEDNTQNNFAILAKESDSQKKEVLVLLEDDAVALEPNGPKGVTVKVNGQHMHISEKSISRWNNGQNQIEAHALPDKSNAVLYFPYHRFQLYYDGQSVAIMLPHQYRNQVRGLCGTFDGEPANDFTTPENCVRGDQRLFAASYALPEENCQGHAREFQRKAQSSRECYTKSVVHGSVVSDNKDGQRSLLKSRGVNNSITVIHQVNQAQQSCSVYKVKIFQEPGQICFSHKPWVECNSHCKPTRNIERVLEFNCLSNADKLSTHWMSLVRKGAIPDISQKSTTRKINVLLPESCFSK